MNLEKMKIRSNIVKINLKRVYDPASKEDGLRILIERLWPRGVKKEDLKMDEWLKEVAPSTDLRKWFSHDPAKWKEFQKKYFEELDENQVALEPILKALHKNSITLLYSSKDTEHNNAVCLRNYLEKHKKN
ncbi:Uncharacterized protein YeaO [Candidatus Protochlamydia amoebophila]|uniref:Uncharacterized protein YeaO n=1 Tax=Candidatus Protochlamydia amoebophila TaxID=362787 RepID=A0A0C1HFG6_9BACT|nr:Uncharacterized protein YeaO [Candidatus Protochlamydia amoebophila]